MALVLMSACAVMPDDQVPPPPGLATGDYEVSAAGSATPTPQDSGAASGAQPPKLQRIGPMAPLPAPATPRSAEPLLGAPTIFYAPPSALPPSLQAPPQASAAQVLQAQPGPALSLDFSPNPAWKRAEVPPNSYPETVGRVPPPAAQQGFVIGAGDTVQIDVLGRPELSARGNVAGDGQVTAALVGSVGIGGLTPKQAAEKIGRAYKQGEYLVAPQVTVTMVEYQSQQLTVMGEVRTPGRFPIRTRLSVLDALALAGGINDLGSSVAYLLRPEDSVVTRYEVDLDALIQSGAGQQYFELLAGDILVVPKAEVFYIYGEVRSPNAYRLKPGMTVIQALSLAGGLTDKGSDRRVDVRRKGAEGRLETFGASLNDGVKPDDVVYVRERLF